METMKSYKCFGTEKYSLKWNDTSHPLSNIRSESQWTWIQSTKIILFEEKKKKRFKTNEQDLNDLWANIKQCNIHVFRVPKGTERETKAEKYLKK